MKKFTAVFLLIVCVALPVISLADTCAFCGAPEPDQRTERICSISYTYHIIKTTKYISCKVCLTDTKHMDETIGPHIFQHFKQWVTATLTYEYDYCDTCGYQTTGTTIYH